MHLYKIGVDQNFDPEALKVRVSDVRLETRESTVAFLSPTRNCTEAGREHACSTRVGSQRVLLKCPFS